MIKKIGLFSILFILLCLPCWASLNNPYFHVIYDCKRTSTEVDQTGAKILKLTVSGVNSVIEGENPLTEFPISAIASYIPMYAGYSSVGILFYYDGRWSEVKGTSWAGWFNNDFASYKTEDAIGFIGGPASEGNFPLIVSVNLLLTIETFDNNNCSLEISGFESRGKEIDTRLSILEQWKTTVQSTVDAISQEFDKLKNFIFFGKYQTQTVCNAIKNECGSSCTNECTSGQKGCTDTYTKWSCELQDGCYKKVSLSCGSGQTCSNGVCSGGCTDECTSGQTGCVNSRTRWWCNKYTDQPGCYFKANVDCAAGEDCQNGACVAVPPGSKVVFRTNAVNKAYKSGTWIAVDSNNDGLLEGWDYLSSSGTLAKCSGTYLVSTPENYNVYSYLGYPNVCVRVSGGVTMIKYGKKSTTAVTALTPTAPYSTNGQEVYAS